VLYDHQDSAKSISGHLLRAQAAAGLLIESDKDTFAANHVSSVLADVDLAGALGYL
jgi:hypothetical protein